MYINTLCEQLCEHATHFRGYAPDTIQRYRIATRLFQRSMGVQRIDECTPEVVREFFYRGRAERHWSAQTFVTHHKSLNVFFKWCIERGELQRNPLDGVEVPRLEKALPRRLPEDQARLLLEKVLNYSWDSEFERRRN